MNFENEIVMIGGISQTTGEVFGRLKVKNLKFSNHLLVSPTLYFSGSECKPYWLDS